MRLSVGMNEYGEGAISVFGKVESDNYAYPPYTEYLYLYLYIYVSICMHDS